jgi:CHAD domain-containing protein
MPDGKWIDGLTAGMPVASAAKTVLEARFGVVKHFLPLAVEKPNEDVEYVHQLRVGTRRATAALRVFEDAFPRKLLKATKRTLRRIRQAAGDARDWDVFIRTLPDDKAFASASASAKPALDFLLGYAFGERAAAQTRLAEAAEEAGPLFTEQSGSLPTRAHAPQVEDGKPPANFGELAVRQLSELFRSFTADVEANPTEPETLHKLRIAGKRLRYAIEIFATCFPPEMKDVVYPEVEKVQELLGEVQDAAVGTKRLEGIRDNVQNVMPKELTRLRKGFDALAKSLRAKIPAGKKAFTPWRTNWLKLMKNMTLEAAVVATTA